MLSLVYPDYDTNRLRALYNQLGKISRLRALLGFVVLCIVLTVLYLVQMHRLGTYEVTSESMLPTLKVGQTWLMLPPPAQLLVGQIVVFHHPQTSARMMVKRIAAVPADKVSYQQGELRVNGVIVPSLPDAPMASAGDEVSEPADGEWTLNARQVFVVGDNRNNSVDSRDYGPIAIDSITGVLTRKLKG